MLKTGRDFLEGLRDGRVVYVGGERVEDVTKHSGFRGAALSLAALYDWEGRQKPGRRALLHRGRRPLQHVVPATALAKDLERRMRAHKLVADFSFGLFGRAPDHTGSTLTGSP